VTVEPPKLNMPPSFYVLAIGRAAERLPLLRRMPVARLLILGQLLLLARDHIERLTPKERRRLVMLVRGTRGLPSNLTPAARSELEDLIAKVEPKLFAQTAAGMFSPLPLGRGRGGARRR
jgi:hypothetical protein